VLRGYVLERVSLRDDQLKPASDDVVETSLPTGARDDALDAQRARERICRIAGRPADHAAGERRELEWRRRRSLAQHRVALRRGLRIELAEDLAELDGQADDRFVLRLSLAIHAVQQPLGGQAAQHQIELPRQVRRIAQTRAQPLAQERRSQVGGVAHEQHAAWRISFESIERNS
jgi:hypothetical protein